MPNQNRKLHRARQKKDDEYYTRLVDIENEVRNYDKEYFRGKVIYCNCDDPYESDFFKYFILNFNHLGLKKLITTCYAGSPVAGTRLNLDFTGVARGVAHKIEVTSVNESNGFNLDDVEEFLKGNSAKKKIKKLEGDGDFRSKECIELLQEADVVVTNPPFSLFRDYVAQLIQYKKKFLIIGNKNSITYKETFPLLKDNEMWLGCGSGSMNFMVPARDRGTGTEPPPLKSVGAFWFTNLDHGRRHEDLVLYESYSPEKYPMYENYKAIEVGKTKEIPMDYDGVMGVPITFLQKYNPEQFELIWTTDRGGDGMLEDLKRPHTRYDAPVVNGEGIFKRILIRKKQRP